MQNELVEGPVQQTNPEVTVVIPTRNRWATLEAYGLAAALCQEGVDLEVVVVDDGSTDETARRVAALGDSRVRIVRHEHGNGVARARNAGVAAARGEWIAFLDDDDVWAPNKLRAQLDAAARAAADFVYSVAVHLDEDLRVIAAFAPPSAMGLRATLVSGTPIAAGASNVMARRRLVERVGGFDPQLVGGVEDHECWLRMAAAAPAAATEDILVGYVQHAGSIHLRDAAELFTAFRKYARKYPAPLDVLGIRRHEARYLHWCAGQQRRAGNRLQAMSLYLRAAVLLRRPSYAVKGLVQLAGERGQRLGRAVVPLRDRRSAAMLPASSGNRRPGEQFQLESEPEWIDLYR